MFPQLPVPPSPLMAASIDRTISANASLIIATAGSQASPVATGSAQLAATGAVDGFAILHHIATGQEAAVPMETRTAPSYLLAFDNTAGRVLGVALENVSSQAANIPVVIRDDTGKVITPVGSTIPMAANGHIAFVLSDPLQGFPVTADKRGTIEFITPQGGKISALGIRFTPPNNALTTIPALANVGTGGGSIAHFASGGDGWQTTFVLVNTGASPANATLKFFAGDGSPLALPLAFPQFSGATTTVSTITQTLASGGTLVLDSSGAAALLTGSAQLSTNGNLGGFVIFRHNNQEAAVPWESRNAGSYLLAFDNTNGTATGMAINSISAQAVSVPVVVRDDSGAQIATDTLQLAPNGHLAFTLGVDKYLNAAGIRGTVEFATPKGAQIGVYGLRISKAQTFTTLPVLTK
jgi:hypothetical protein